MVGVCGKGLEFWGKSVIYACCVLLGTPRVGRAPAENSRAMSTTKFVVEPCSAPLPQRPEPLPDNEKSLFERVLSHFQGAYQLSGEGDSTEASDLTSDEKRWLVC